jgi:hypothetical protein
MSSDIYLRKPNEFFSNPEPCYAVRDTQQKFLSEEPIVDYKLLRELNDWGDLSSLVFGSEE